MSDAAGAHADPTWRERELRRLMGVQQIGEKKTQEAALMTGLPIFRALRHSNRLWFGFVREGEGHWHINLDPVTWVWSIGDGAFSSCAEGTWGPHVEPPEALATTAWLREEHISLVGTVGRLKNALGFYADERNYETRPFEGSPDLTINPIEDDHGALARAVLAGEED